MMTFHVNPLKFQALFSLKNTRENISIIMFSATVVISTLLFM